MLDTNPRLTYEQPWMQFQINFKSGKPAHVQIIEQVKASAASGALRAGEALPSISSVGAELHINRNAIAKAYSELERVGLVETLPGKGTFLRDTQTPLKKDARRKLLTAEIDQNSVMAPQADQKPPSYSLLMALLTAVYLGLVGGIGMLVVWSGLIRSQALVVLITVVVAAILMPLRTRLQDTAERFVFAKRYELPQALQTIKTEGISQPDLESFIHRVIANVEDALSAHIEVIRDYSDLLLMVNAHPQLRTARRPIWTGQDLLTPVIAHDEVFAVIRATRSARDKDFDSDDSDFLIAVAEQVGIAATHFRLRREKQEAEYALEIQRALLPREVPQFSGFTIAGTWQPARTVGGDYYDVFRLDESKIALVVADVSGKGIPASLLMANLQATVKAYATAECSPKDLCEKVNRAVCNSITTGKFITFVYAVLDSSTQTLTYVNAGHNPPIIVRPDADCITLEVGGTVLGMFPTWPYEQATINLQPNDQLVIFTDGVTEASSPEGDEFGEERLIDLLQKNPSASATHLRDVIMHGVTQFCREDFADDATLLVVAVGMD